MIGPAAVELEAARADHEGVRAAGPVAGDALPAPTTSTGAGVVTERRRAAQPRALSDHERAEVLEVLHSAPVRRRVPGHGVGDPARRRHLSGVAGHDVPAPAPTTRRCGRAAPPGHPPAEDRVPSWPPRHRTTSGPGTSPACVARANGTSSTSTCCWTCSRATCPAGCSPPSRTPSSPDASSTKPCPPRPRPHRVDDPLRPWCPRRQAGRPAARHARDHPVGHQTENAQRQPLLRSPVPHHEIPAPVPDLLRRHRRRPRVLRRVLRLAQLRAPPLRHRVPHPGVGLLRHRPRDPPTTRPPSTAPSPPTPNASSPVHHTTRLPEIVYINPPQEAIGTH